MLQAQTIDPAPAPSAVAPASRPVGARCPTVGEEIANSLTHGLGLLLAIVGLATLMERAGRYGDAGFLVAGAIYGTTLILLYAASTLYHALPLPRARAVFLRLDHACIYLLIAGTYTPFALVTLRGPWGDGLLGAIWALAGLGVVFETRFHERFQKVSVALYVAMGWCFLLVLGPLKAALAPRGLELLLAGGLAYTGGVSFYARRSLRYGHAVWHGFVLLGSVLHYLAVLLYVVPPTAGAGGSG